MRAEESELTYEILAYLAENADAEDTLEGIVEWWLLEQKIKSCTVNVREILAQLAAENLINEYRGTDSRPRFRLNQERYTEILAILQSRKEQAGS